MAFFSQDFIEEVLDRNDIVDVISSYVSLKKKGANYWGLCPFHGEKTPSFSVNANQQFYHCFGCHVGGDAINFVQKVERMDFQESVVFLAERAKLPIPETKNSTSYIPSDEKEKMYNVMKEAARWYRTNLFSEVGKEAREYVSGRGISDSIIKRFGLGFAPNKWNELTDYMNGKGIENELLFKIGLAKEKNGSYYDTFRNRIMFPIIDRRMRVIGFGGRVIDDSKPKYLNSPETPIFNKRYNLYGIHSLNKINKVDKIMVVEGYMDVISLHQAGFTQVLASLGTALTEGQAKLMKRYSEEIYICYDGDTAGQKATLKGLDVLQAEGLKVKVMSMPDGVDPDDFAKKYGIVGIQDKMSQAKTLNDYKIMTIEANYDLSIEEQRKNFLQECCKDVLAYIDTPLELSMYEKRLHEKTGFPIVAIDAETQMAKKALGKTNRHANTAETAINIDSQNNVVKKEIEDTGLVRAERIALQLAAIDSHCREKLFDEISFEDFTNSSRKKIAKAIYELGDKKTTIGKLLTHLGDEDAKEMGQEQIELIKDYMTTVEQCAEKINYGKLKRKRLEMLQKMDDINTTKEEKKQLIEKIQELDKYQKKHSAYKRREIDEQ
ncbi:MAG: DNA primase [Eubacteriales bacterium]